MRAWAPRIVAVLSLGVLAAAFSPYSVDDAYVLARYAARLARGAGWTFVDGPPTDGVTGPLGVVPGSVAAWLGADPLLTSKATGVLAALFGVGALLAALRRSTGSSIPGGVGKRPVRRRMASAALTDGEVWAAAGLMSVQGALAAWAGAGLETGLAIAAGCAVAAGLLPASEDATSEDATSEDATVPEAARRTSAALWTSAAAMAVPWLRPELVPFAAIGVSAVWLGDRRRDVTLDVETPAEVRRVPWRHLAPVAFVASGGAVIAFRLALFGHAWPMAASAKPGELGHGAMYVLAGACVITGAGGIPLAVRGAQRAPWLGIALVVHFGVVLLAGGDWMPGFRLLSPAVPGYVVLAALGAPVWRVRAVRLVLLALAFLVPALDVAVQLPRARAAAHAREVVGRPLGLRLGAFERVALVDVGFLVHVGDFTPIDLGGITDPAVAHRPGGHVAKAIDPGWLAAADPDAILLHATAAPRVDDDGRLVALAGHPVERRVARFPWVRTRFRVREVVRYAPGYFYVLLVRE